MIKALEKNKLISYNNSHEIKPPLKAVVVGLMNFFRRVFIMKKFIDLSISIENNLRSDPEKNDTENSIHRSRYWS